jgi:hypothetical protein
MLRLTIVSFALNIVSIFLSVLNHTHEKTAEIEKTTYQKYKTLIDTGNLINAPDSLIDEFGHFPRNILT